MGNDITIKLEIKGSDYRCLADRIRKQKHAIRGLELALDGPKKTIRMLGINDQLKESIQADIDNILKETAKDMLKDMHMIATIIERGEAGTEQRKEQADERHSGSTTG